MRWLSGLFSNRQQGPAGALQEVQQRYRSFQRLLDRNNQVLLELGDLEEKAQGEYLFDINYILAGLERLRILVQEILAEMVVLGGERYLPLRRRFLDICQQIDSLLPGHSPLEQDDFTRPLDRIDSGRIASFGGKNAQLGEMKSRLGLPVPAGFAISAWAYKHFIHANDLQERITSRLSRLDIRNHTDLLRASEEIQHLVRSSPIPRDLTAAILQAYRRLKLAMGATRVSLRSSAVGENTLFSFAGQYASFLNIGEHELVDCYREVIASKFTPKAIYYFLSHTITEQDLAMAVGCIEMIDAVSSGVVYTRDPLAAESERLFIHAVLGLGKYLVDGTLTPDVFEVSRDDLRLVAAQVADKRVRLVVAEDGGTRRETVPRPQRLAAALGEPDIRTLAEYALQLERHYGSPQDIEWALARSGQLYLLQTRPLRMVSHTAPRRIQLPGCEPLATGSATIFPGAGSGPVALVRSPGDLAGVPAGAVLVAEHPFPGLITALLDVNALITEVGNVASHLATLAREYQIPALAGVQDVSRLEPGQIVTVDASGCAVYAGRQQQVLEARRPGDDLIEETPTFQLLRQVLPLIAPLHVLDPGDGESFTCQRCSTIHDITRFCHQKAIEEISRALQSVQNKEQLACQLVSELPLPILLIFLEEEFTPPARIQTLSMADVACDPLQAFMKGMHDIGWPPETVREGIKHVKSLETARTSDRAGPETRETSFAFVSGEYMLLSLRMGFHLSTVEANCSAENSKNYIRLEHKSGGGVLDRRVRRIKLIMDLLTPFGFTHHSKSDYLSSICSYLDEEGTLKRLEVLGRLTMLTKQLDMALANDTIAAWYTQDFRARLDDGGKRGGS